MGDVELRAAYKVLRAKDAEAVFDAVVQEEIPDLSDEMVAQFINELNRRGFTNIITDALHRIHQDSLHGIADDVIKSFEPKDGMDKDQLIKARSDHAQNYVQDFDLDESSTGFILFGQWAPEDACDLDEEFRGLVLELLQEWIDESNSLWHLGSHRCRNHVHGDPRFTHQNHHGPSMKKDNYLLQRNNILMRQAVNGAAVTGEYTFVRRMIYRDDPDAVAMELFEDLEPEHHAGVREELLRYQEAVT